MKRSLVALAAVVVVLSAPESSSAAACDFQGPGNDWHAAANWSCMKVPDTGDSVTIGTADNVTVAAAASAGSLSIANAGTITFSGSPTLAVSGTVSSTGGTVAGAGTLTAGGAFSKTTAANFTLQDAAQVSLNAASTLDGGGICVSSTGTGDPSFVINQTFTIGAGADTNAFSCGIAAGPRVVVGATGELVKEAAGVTQSFTEIDNDGTLTVQQGTFTMLAGGGTAISAGDFVADAGATLNLSGVNQLSATGRLGGAGTIGLSSGVNTTTLASGAVLDPAVLDIGGTLVVNGNAALALPDVRLDGNPGALDSDRPLTATALSVTGGRVLDTTELTVPPGGSFSKTTAGNFRLEGSASVTLNLDASLDGGGICVSSTGAGDPSFVINQTFTLGAGADQNAFNCGVAAGPRVVVGGPSGHLVKAGAGTSASFTDIEVAGGTVSVASGQTINAFGAYSQTGGLTDVASGGVLGASPALTGGVLRGAGQVSGDVVNTSGSVEPGASPGVLNVTGNYTQGAGGTLAVEIAGSAPGTGDDRLAVGGTVSLDGTLAIATDPGFDPALTDTFDVVTSTGALSGSFATLTGAQLGGKEYLASYTAGPPGKATLGVGAVAPPPPVNNTLPSVSGTAQVGNALSCDSGAWTGSPSFAFQWLRDGAPIAGATSQTYTLADADAGRSIACRVTATSAGGSTEATSNAVVPSPRPVTPPERTETIRGDRAFTEGTANDLYLACTKLDLLLIDVLRRGRRRIYISGAADLRLVGQTVEIFLGRRSPGVRVGSTTIRPDGGFGLTVKAPRGARARKAARYQARVGRTRSQRLRLVRRMVATKLSLSGGALKLTGVLLRPFTRPPTVIEVEHYLSCRRREKVAVARVRPKSSGRFTLTIPISDGVPAVLYRARTRAPTIPTGRIANVFTLPRAVDLL